MRLLLFVILGSILGSVLTYAGLAFLCHFSADVSLGVASVPLMAMHHVCELVEKARIRSSIARSSATSPPVRLPSFEGFAISGGKMFLFVLLATFAIPNVTSLLSGVLVSLFGAEGSAAMLAVNFPLALLVMFLFGKWVGTRANASGFWVMLGALFLGISSVHLFDFFVLSADQWTAFFGRDKSLATLAMMIGSGFTDFAIACMFGFWRGRRLRMAIYLNYLLTLLPQDTRKTIVSLAYDESCAVTAR
jgi:hypothetical protein